MDKQVVSLMKMNKIPENCWKCDYYGCPLPVMDQMEKAYKDKRHPSCPLRLVDQENLQEV